ncbi:MAG: hypothetical protein U5K81_08060 [Trueperaceae bacterium]|nr:hypothetical protein [Trueperaceae bacterium]
MLSVDLDALEAMEVKSDASGDYVYDLPTLDDPTRTNESDGSDPGDPFGGNDGLNQARIVFGGPVQVYSPGYRNAYDLVITLVWASSTSYDNGANDGWGGYPEYEESYDCTNAFLSGEPGSSSPGPDPAAYLATWSCTTGTTATAAERRATRQRGQQRGQPAPRPRPGLLRRSPDSGARQPRRRWPLRRRRLLRLLATPTCPTTGRPFPSIGTYNAVECDFRNPETWTTARSRWSVRRPTASPSTPPATSAAP